MDATSPLWHLSDIIDGKQAPEPGSGNETLGNKVIQIVRRLINTFKEVHSAGVSGVTGVDF